MSYVIPGLSSLSGLLTRSLSPASTSVQGITHNLDKDLPLYEHKAKLYMDHLSEQAPTREDGVKELSQPCPLRFWFGQVYLDVSEMYIYLYSCYLGRVR